MWNCLSFSIDNFALTVWQDGWRMPCSSLQRPSSWTPLLHSCTPREPGQYTFLKHSVCQFYEYWSWFLLHLPEHGWAISFMLEITTHQSSYFLLSLTHLVYPLTFLTSATYSWMIVDFRPQITILVDVRDWQTVSDWLLVFQCCKLASSF